MRGGPGSTAGSRPLARRHSGIRAPEPLVIASSDSEDVECVTPFSQTRSQRQQRPRASQPAAPDPDDNSDSDFAAPLAIRRGGRAHSAGTWTAPAPKRARVQPPHGSSPPLLRASSPTVARANRDCLAAAVLAQCTQDACGVAPPPSPPPIGTIDTTAAADGLLDCIPETPPGSPLASFLGSPRADLPARAAGSAGVPSDPISEFCSPAVSPAPPRAATGSAQLPGPTAQVQQRDDPGATSITQWYLGNLAKDDESDSSLSLRLTSDRDSPACGDSSASAHPGTELAGSDGYSSPLEGFWDLRDNMQGSTQDRDMYMCQFEPTDRQRANRARKEARRAPFAPAQPDISLPPVISPPQVAGRSGTQGRSRRGRGARARPVRGGKGARQRRGGSASAIRPVRSQRAPAPRAAAVPVAYNHYADDPHLDIAGSLNWEGGGMARFG
ncbi:hypothetical protein H4R21_004034 [Coemansia helicoidea]|uniref:Uncharacterized protein n=1 Tax=Coemansia helicoidea TaxID=1286919 RepID=A0ACC1KZY3_9FUNG|nr:hypothetical protein H4R21_004034 [Coemansia helicoidea]